MEAENVKTETLIDLTSRDTRRRAPLGRTALIAIALSIGAAWIGLVVTLGVRSDIEAALGTVRFLFKFVFSGGLALAATWFAVCASRPAARLAPAAIALAVTALALIASVLAELISVSPQEWAARMIGSNSFVCVVAIPLLAIVPLSLLLIAMRRGAAGSPMLAGAACGLAAGAAAATAYAAHCPDDSPLFVAVWYVLAIAITTAAGALIGARALRW
jgi:hypothetical protein